MLVKNIVNFARSTNMKSCIEGVEDKSLQDYLRSFGATWFQGYYYSKPVGEEQLKKLLLEEMYNKKDASWFYRMHPFGQYTILMYFNKKQ